MTDQQTERKELQNKVIDLMLDLGDYGEAYGYGEFAAIWETMHRSAVRWRAMNRSAVRCGVLDEHDGQA